MIDTAIGAVADPTERFFAYARQRHAVYLRRWVLRLPQPWTADPILGRYRFTNVFRELDAVTLWFKRYVREPLRAEPECLFATVLFRWFNRITSGETIFCQPDMVEGGATLFKLYCSTKLAASRRALLRNALRRQGPPFVTGSYTINSPAGKSKLDGVLHMADQFFQRDWRVRGQQLLTPRFNHTMQGTWRWLMDGSEGLGPFMAYEVVCDLRYTDLLSYAADKNTWASAGGPGARRGAARVLGLGVDDKGRPRAASEKQTAQVMESLLASSRDAEYWPQRQEFSAGVGDGLDRKFMYWKFTDSWLPGQQLMPEDLVKLENDSHVGGPAWPVWEMREVEHTLCEFDKYERTRLGQGRPRGVFSR